MLSEYENSDAEKIAEQQRHAKRKNPVKALQGDFDLKSNVKVKLH